MSPEYYIKEREKAIAQENGLPKENDEREIEPGKFEVYYQGKWTPNYELPVDHPKHLPF